MIEFDESANEPAEPITEVPNKATIYKGLTKRERACIDLLYPDSGLNWLNEMIRARKRDELARHIMTGFFNSIEWIPIGEPAPTDGLPFYKEAILDSYMLADFAMLKAGEEV